MKAISIFSALFLFIFPAIRGQEVSSGQRKLYQVWVIPQKGFHGKSGILYKVADSSVMVSNPSRTSDYQQGKYSVTSFSITGIRDLRIRKKGRGLAIIVGGAAGLVTGITISAVYMNYLEKTMDPFGFAFGGFLLGLLPAVASTGIGFTTGAVLAKKKNITIDGSQVNFERHRADLNEGAFLFNPEFSPSGAVHFNKLTNSVSDRDGNTYPLIALGAQVWMAENLKTTHYRDGSDISGIRVTGNDVRYTWTNQSKIAMLCPEGFHVPSLSEWTSLVNSVGGDQNASTSLDQGFTNALRVSQWWSSTETDSLTAQSLYLNSSRAGILYVVAPKSTGLAIRCIRDY